MEHYPDDALGKLGFDAIRQRLRGLCMSEEGRELAEAFAPLPTPDACRLALRQTHEAVQLLGSGEAPPLQSIPSIRSVLAKARIEGNYITEEEAQRLARWLDLVRRTRQYFAQRAEAYPALGQLVAGQTFDTSLLAHIETIVDRDGRMLSTASPELASLRRSINDRSTEVRRLLDRLLRHARDQNWTDGRELTLRNERLVIPLSEGAKHRIPGIVHDVSATGQTVFLEPLEALSLNNDIRSLRVREQNEVIRILTQLTDRIRPLIPDYQRFSHFVTQVDVLLAKAKLAQAMQATLPALSSQAGKVQLIRARHPLLVLQLGHAKVVPLDLSLDPQRRVLVLSGPNAGGKSVVLKTVGLLQLMLQSGLLVPTDPDSQFGWFDRLFVDIGDDQSIANNLSTYSSHLAHMRVLLERLSPKSLFLIDEFGTGTDPLLGGPIAEAMLARFLDSRAWGVVTTHYSNLKDFAANHPHTANAAMQFDSATLQPTFRLLQGAPGSSYALEMAQRAGIPPQVITDARNRVGSRADADVLLGQLKQREAELAELLAQAQRRERDLAAQVQHQKAQSQDAQAKRRQIIQQAQETAAEMIRNANAKIEATIREIREAQADKELTKQLRRELEQAQLLTPEEIADPDAEPAPEATYEPRPDEIPAVGDWVQLEGTGARGRVLEHRGNRMVVAMGELRTVVPAKEVVKIAPATTVSSTRSNVASVQRTAEANHQLDVRGKRVEAALVDVDRFMDQALLAGLDQLVILHGKGSGALRNAIRDHLRKMYSQVQRLEDGPAQGGAEGLTLVTLGQ